MAETSVSVSDPQSLLVPLTEEQQLLVETVGEEFAPTGHWPVFQHVEYLLDHHGLQAVDILNSFPALGGRYFCLHVQRVGLAEPHEGSPVVLTVLGIHHCHALRRDPPLQNAYFRILDYLSDALRRNPTVPDKPRKVFVSVNELTTHLGSLRYPVDRLPASFLWDLLVHEPPTPGAYAGPGGVWEWEVRRDVREFEGIVEMRDYLERLARMLV